MRYSCIASRQYPQFLGMVPYYKRIARTLQGSKLEDYFYTATQANFSKN